jgi:signal transduction histidine kinase
MSRIFTPFFSTKETGKGMGIGLSIAFQIVNNAGGSIEVASTLGEGATFTVRIPLIRHA